LKKLILPDEDPGDHPDIRLRRITGGGIYQRRTKNGTGRLKKTVPLGTAKTQRMETEATVSAIDEEVRFFFIFLGLSCKKRKLRHK
jgi:hypothetical protein